MEKIAVETDTLADEFQITVQIADDAEKPAHDGPPEHQYEYPKGLKRALILVPVTLAYFVFFLDLAIVSTATPAITSTFNSLVDVGWYGGAYQLGGSAFQPLSGKIYKYFSTKASYPHSHIGDVVVEVDTKSLELTRVYLCSGPFLPSSSSSSSVLCCAEPPSHPPCSSSGAPSQASAAQASAMAPLQSSPLSYLRVRKPGSWASISACDS